MLVTICTYDQNNGENKSEDGIFVLRFWRIQTAIVDAHLGRTCGEWETEWERLRRRHMPFKCTPTHHDLLFPPRTHFLRFLEPSSPNSATCFVPNWRGYSTFSDNTQIDLDWGLYCLLEKKTLKIRQGMATEDRMDNTLRGLETWLRKSHVPFASYVVFSTHPWLTSLRMG